MQRKQRRLGRLAVPVYEGPRGDLPPIQAWLEIAELRQVEHLVDFYSTGLQRLSNWYALMVDCDTPFPRELANYDWATSTSGGDTIQIGRGVPPQQVGSTKGASVLHMRREMVKRMIDQMAQIEREQKFEPLS